MPLPTALEPDSDLLPLTAVRAFFALVPDDGVRREFVTLAREVARRCRGRAIIGDHVHLTLAFLGDVPPAALPALRAIGDRLPRIEAVLGFDVLGAWRASGVAWVAPSTIPAALVALYGTLRGALQEAGFAVDTREFRPHVTLARRCVQPQTRARCAPLVWPVHRLCLVGSQLRPDGPLYTELAAWPEACVPASPPPPCS
jgi:2'-5' RNA ligase